MVPNGIFDNWNITGFNMYEHINYCAASVEDTLMSLLSVPIPWMQL